MNVFQAFADEYHRQAAEELSLQDYLQGCREDPMMYASAAERMIAAIGEEEVIDTSTDPRLGRIFLNPHFPDKLVNRCPEMEIML